MYDKHFPKIHILSKNDLAKHISHKDFPYEQALALINDVLLNFDRYWKDSKLHSEPEKDKYVRNAKGTLLGKLLEMLNERVLAPHDHLLPNFVFGGLHGRNHVSAAAYLLGRKRKRTLLKADIHRFFEQVGQERVEQFLKKCGCSARAARLIARLCCVPLGPKGSSSSQKAIARGFATSSRLAVWCNLNIFLRVDELIKKELQGKDGRLAIYVDDIGVTASRATASEMHALYAKIETLLKTADRRQSLPLSPAKMKIVQHHENPEHLGIALGRNKLDIGRKTRRKIGRVKAQLKKAGSPEEKVRLKRKYTALAGYRRFVTK